jgi:hypothetical protein
MLIPLNATPVQERYIVENMALGCFRLSWILRAPAEPRCITSSFASSPWLRDSRRNPLARWRFGNGPAFFRFRGCFWVWGSLPT